MSWKLRCPFCRTAYKIEPEHQGTVCQCAKCGKEFSIPDDIQSRLDNMPDPPDCGRGGLERRAENQDYRDDSRVVLCPNCFKEIALNNDFCPRCGYGLRNIPRAGGKPFLCYLLNILGFFGVLFGGVALVIAGIAAGYAYFNPSEIASMDRSGVFFKEVLISFAVFFGGLILFGISSVINRASRRW